jgi:hypothetical protein
MGGRGPFGLLIHPEYGPWWALRSAWLVDASVEASGAPRLPCAGCAAPCVGGWENADSTIASASPEARARCVVGAPWRYDDDQLDYHHARAETVARLRARRGS